MAPIDETTLGWLRDLENQMREDRKAASERWEALVNQLRDMQHRLDELHQDSINESQATLMGRAECQRVVTERLDRLEDRGISVLLWEGRKQILACLAGLVSVAGVAAAAVAPSVLPVIEQLRRSIP